MLSASQISFISGVTSVSILGFVLLLYVFAPIPQLGPFVEFLGFCEMVVGLIGIFFGGKALKSSKQKMAIVGITLSFIGLIVPIYSFLFG